MFFKNKSEVVKLSQELVSNSSYDDNEVLFIRRNDLIHGKNAVVEVPSTHNAIIIKGGGDYKLCPSGNYKVFDDKHEYKDFKKGLSVEVIYIPKDTRVLIKWGTPNRIKYRDEASRKVVSIGARGEFDVSVSDADKFYRVVVGAKKEFNLEEFSARFSETVANKFANIFLTIVKENHLTYDQFDINKELIGVKMGETLDGQFKDEFGLSVRRFLIADFNLSGEDIEAIEGDAAEKLEKETAESEEQKRRERLKEYLAELERLDDKQWEREKYLKQLELQDKQAYYEVLKIIGKNDGDDKGDKKDSELKCSFCGANYRPSDKFCPRCGKRVGNYPVACPKCGAVNDYQAVYCSKCGKKLQN